MVGVSEARERRAFGVARHPGGGGTVATCARADRAWQIPDGGDRSGSAEHETMSLRIGGLRGRLVDDCALAADKLVISSWGGSWKDLIEQTVAKKFNADTGARGRVHHRRHHRPAQQGQARQGLARKRRHLHDVACRLALCHRRPVRDARSRQDPEHGQAWSRRPRSAPIHIGTWAYVYTIGYRPDLLPAGIKFDTWADLWKPELKGKTVGARFRRQPSGRRWRPSSKAATPATWEKGQAKAQGAQAQLQGLSTPTTRPRSS